MNKTDADKIIGEYVKKLFGFAVQKTYSLSEAEELASEIVMEVYRTLLHRENIVNINGYIYKVAENVYANFIDKNRYRFSREGCSFDEMENISDNTDMTEKLLEEETAGLLRREITYLSSLRREIIVQRYFKDKSIQDIAKQLCIPQNTVKWHLNQSRKELKKGMEKVRTTGTLGTQPIRLINMGHSGRPGSKGDTADFLARSLTQNIAYAAYHQPRTVNEIADELGVNPLFVSDEVDVLEEYGYMDKLPDGKYRTNIHINIWSEERNKIYREIMPKYTKLFAEKFFAPVLNGITEIPSYITVPDGDINLLKWCLVFFLSNRVGVVNEDDGRFSVKRPDGGDFVANACLDIGLDIGLDNSDGDKYWACGSMWRRAESNDCPWISWQLNCHWTDRERGWRDNLLDDYEKLYRFLRGELPEQPVNADSYRRLLDKGYLLKKDGGYKCNIILCDNEKKWWDYIPAAPVEITELSKEYAKEAARAELIGQPEHMHQLIEYYAQNDACSLHTRIIDRLLDMGVLKMPTDEQKKGLCTILFLNRE